MCPLPSSFPPRFAPCVFSNAQRVGASFHEKLVILSFPFPSALCVYVWFFFVSVFVNFVYLLHSHARRHSSLRKKVFAMEISFLSDRSRPPHLLMSTHSYTHTNTRKTSHSKKRGAPLSRRQQQQQFPATHFFWVFVFPFLLFSVAHTRYCRQYRGSGLVFEYMFHCGDG